MNKFLITGMTVVNLALIAYSIAIFNEQKKKLANNIVLGFISGGVFFDIIATTCMIIGSTHTALSSHGYIGYSSLSGMLVDCVLLWKFRLNNGEKVIVKKNLHIYSRIAYLWWIMAYITGAIIVSIRHMH